jgi:glyoxylate reductase
LTEQCEVKNWDSTLPIPSDVLYQWVEDAEGIFCSGKVRVDERLLLHAEKVRVITQASVGYDNIDVDACTRRGIPFGNTPHVLVEATADLTFGILLSAARRIHEGWLQVRAGEWKNNFAIPFGNDLYGKVLGITGMGSIGAAVAKRAQTSGMQVIYHNRNRRKDDELLGTAYVSFNELLERSDFIVVLVPLSEQTKGLIGARELSRMKPTAYFINVARGGIVDSDALYRALKNRQIAYAALDVTNPEPLPASHPLLELDNILITPHIGSATHETRDKMARLAVDNLLAGLVHKPLQTCVNQSVNYVDEERQI